MNGSLLVRRSDASVQYRSSFGSGGGVNLRKEGWGLRDRYETGAGKYTGRGVPEYAHEDLDDIRRIQGTHTTVWYGLGWFITHRSFACAPAHHLLLVYSLLS